MAILLACDVDPTGKVRSSCIDELDSSDETGVLPPSFPDAWIADVSLHVALRSGSTEEARAIWKTSPANRPLCKALEKYDIQAFLNEVGVLPAEAILRAAIADQEPPQGYANLHGARPNVRFAPSFPAEQGWLRAFSAVRGSPLLAERAAALRWLLDQAAASRNIIARGTPTPLKKQLDLELAVILESWFDAALADMEMAFIDAGRDLGLDQPPVGTWLQKLVFHVFPRHAIDRWRVSRSIGEHWAKRLARSDAWLVGATYENAAGTTPLRPLPLGIVRELRRIAERFSSDETEDREVVARARWVLAASGAGWLTNVEPEKRLETVRWMLDKLVADPRENLPFAQTLVREQAALDDESRAAVSDQVDMLAEESLDKYIEALVLTLPVTLGQKRPLSTQVMENILKRSVDSPSMKEGLRSFGEIAARTGRWDEWTLALETLTELSASQVDPTKRKQAALLALEHVAEAKRSSFKTEEIELVSKRALEELKQASSTLGGDIDVERELWRLTKETR